MISNFHEYENHILHKLPIYYEQMCLCWDSALFDMICCLFFNNNEKPFPVNTWRLKDVGFWFEFWSRRYITNIQRHSVGFWRQYDVARSSTLFLHWNTTVFQSQFIDQVKSLDLNITKFSWIKWTLRVDSTYICYCSLCNIELSPFVAVCLMNCFTRIIIINILLLAYFFANFRLI